MIAALVTISIIAVAVVVARCVTRRSSPPPTTTPTPEDLVADILAHGVRRDRELDAAKRRMQSRYEAQMRRWDRDDWAAPERDTKG